MTLAYACIAPHGGEIIPNLAPKNAGKKFVESRKGMIKIAKLIRAANPDTVIIATPHNLRLWKNVGIVTTENSSGTFRASRASRRSVALRVKCDREFSLALLNQAARKLPAVGANYGTAEGATSDMPMDWGTLVPLWFITKYARRKPKTVILTPSREIPLRQNYEFGRIVADLAEKKRKRYVFVASADQAHAHKKSGPYGFSKAAAKYDKFVLDAIRENRVSRIMDLKPRFVEDAKPDSLWQMTMLAGILSRVPMRAELFSYEVPTYYGMTCAGFQRIS